MSFAFVGFSQVGTYRVFRFELLPRSPGQEVYHVRADMALARKHGILLQELPALCEGLIENGIVDAGSHALTYSATEMLAHANARESAKARKPGRSFPPRNGRPEALLPDPLQTSNRT